MIGNVRERNQGDQIARSCWTCLFGLIPKSSGDFKCAWLFHCRKNIPFAVMENGLGCKNGGKDVRQETGARHQARDERMPTECLPFWSGVIVVHPQRSSARVVCGLEFVLYHLGCETDKFLQESLTFSVRWS